MFVGKKDVAGKAWQMILVFACALLMILPLGVMANAVSTDKNNPEDITAAIASESLISNSIGDGKNSITHYYKFTAKDEDNVYTFVINSEGTSSNYSMTAQLTDENSSSVFKSSLYGTTTKTFVEKLKRGKTYYLSVTTSKKFSYSLKVTEKPDDAPDLRENAKLINVGDLVKGTLYTKGERDWYKIVTSGESEAYTFVFNNLTVEGSSTGLIVYDEEGQKLKVTCDKGKTASKKIKLKPNTTYYIELGYFSTSDRSGDYTFKVMSEADVPDEMDNAKEIAPDTTYSEGISTTADVDWYKLPVESTQKTYTINLNNVDGTYAIHLDVIDRDEQATKRVALSATKGNTDTKSVSLEGGKQYYFKVYTTSDSYLGNYSFNYSVVSTGGDEQTENLNAFVNRLYSLVLGREADESGRNDWVTKLKEKKQTATEVCFGFFFSSEMNARAVSNEEFVKIAYRVMMDREADEGGLDYWVKKLDGGISRQCVLSGFTNSDEFAAICGRYSIDVGKYTSEENRDQNEGITFFAARCYTKALGRNYDVNGLNDWCGRILNSGNRRATALDMASNGFFHSIEFQNKGTSNEEYVDILYRTFLGREADEAGRADWVGKLNAGVSRDDVMAGFSGSAEFDNIMKSYGL